MPFCKSPPPKDQTRDNRIIENIIERERDKRPQRFAAKNVIENTQLRRFC